EMTVRRTEVPLGGTANAAGAPIRKGPRKPSLDVMGPGTDRETPLGRNKPRSGLVSANDSAPPAKSRPHQQDAREAHGSDFVPLNPEDHRPKPRSIGGRAGSDVGKR